MLNSGQTQKTDRTAESIKLLGDRVDAHVVRQPTFEGKHELVPGNSPAGKQRKEKVAEKEMTKEDFQEILLQTESIEMLNMSEEKPDTAAFEPHEPRDKVLVREERKSAR